MTDDNPDREPVLPKIIAGVAAAAIGARLDPAAAILIGGAGYKFEAVAQRSWAEVVPPARHRVARMLAAAARKLGCTDHELEDKIAKTDETLLLTAKAMSAAARTAWPQQVVALGRLLADGLIAEGDEVLLPQYAMNVMQDLDRVDVILLDLLVRHRPGPGEGDTWQAVEVEPEPDQYWRPGWDTGVRVWDEEQITDARPEIGDVLPSVAGTLTRHGLAAQVDRTREAMEQTMKDLREQVNRQANAAANLRRPIELDTRSRLPVSFGVERRWSPTRLGEIVLGYYLEAAEQKDDVPDEPAE